LRRALNLLRQGVCYAEELNRDIWDFAVEISTLRSVGVTNNECRWLVCRGYVEHGRETALDHEGRRQFQRCSGLKFFKSTCFVLTAAGRTAASFDEEIDTRESKASPRRHTNGHASLASDGPHWDQDRHQFRVGTLLIKEFKLPAINQETVLMAFQEEGWPPSIDDPLPPSPGIDPKRRLHDTIKNLNRNQKQHAVRFMGDGTGQGIRWEMIGHDHRNGNGSD
jgi:hypothetical protein